MAQYQVPQFIEVEDKIFGPLTMRQFIWLAGGGGLCLMCFTFLPLYLTIICSIPIMSFSAALAFFQVNGRPFIYALEHAFGYYIGTKLYLWQQREREVKPTAAATPAPATLPVPKLSESKLRDLSWSLNIKDRNRTDSSTPDGLKI